MTGIFDPVTSMVIQSTMNMISIPIFLVLSTAIFAEIEHPHLVKDLPGAPKEPRIPPLYSGYIDVEINGNLHGAFYVLCESIRSNPLDSPLVVWLNGGPGGSSLLGMFLEHGPYLVDPITGKLRYNDFSWNQYSNVLYIESPSNVGFSHAKERIDYYSDRNVADQNMKTLHQFMTRIHPRYATRDFFISGTSFAGNYVPFFAQAIYKGLKNRQFTNHNFKGIAIGNAGMDLLTRKLDSAMQSFAIGMIPQKFGSKLYQYWQVWQNEINIDSFSNLNNYIDANFKHLFDARENTSEYNVRVVCEHDEDVKKWHIAPAQKEFGCNPEFSTLSVYLNRKDVQNALHATRSENVTIKWTAINGDLFKKYDFFQAIDTAPLYKPIFQQAMPGFRILLYTGDLDLVCSALHVAAGAERIVAANDLEQITYSPKTWLYLGDFGGALTSYKSARNVTFDVLTVRGAGHTVPINQPVRAFQIINNFLFSTGSPIDYSKKIRRRKFAN